jgi:chromosomal replication initiation ATPase DnaA
MTLARRRAPEFRFGAPTPAEVLAAVGERFGVTVLALKGESRIRKFVRPRQLAFLLLNEGLGLSCARIGELLGGRKRETVFDGLGAIRRRLAADPALAESLAEIRRRLGLQRCHPRESGDPEGGTTSPGDARANAERSDAA